MNKIFYVPNESAARSSFYELKAKWGRLFPSAVGILERDLDSRLTFFQFDATYWTVLRTINPVERLNKEFKRRTKAMEVTGAKSQPIAAWLMWLRRWSIAGAFIPSLNGHLFTHKTPLDLSRSGSLKPWWWMQFGCAAANDLLRSRAILKGNRGVFSRGVRDGLRFRWLARQ